jgi:hypothetical protein
MHSRRNVFGVFPEFGDVGGLAASKWSHVARVRSDPSRRQPPLTVWHR